MVIVDSILAVLALIAAIFLAWRPALEGRYDPIQTGVTADVALLLLGIGIAFTIWRLARAPTRAWRPLLRVVLYTLALVLGGMAWSRAVLERHARATTQFWPPKLGPARAVNVDSLSPADAARWGLRVAIHAAAGQAIAEPPAIPAEWPFPANVTLAIQATPDGATELWARSGAEPGAIACHAVSPRVQNRLPSSRLTPSCAAISSAPSGLSFVRPIRVREVPSTAPSGAPLAPWFQYRADASRGAASSGNSLLETTALGWRTETHTEIRASVSVVGDFVLVGGHNTGLIVALDLATGAPRWATSAANWIHQEPVSDGRIGVVGFGDNLKSFSGRAPSGVTAFDVATGRRLWTRFDESSVMTSPVIHDSVLIYATAAGVLRKRLLSTGALLDEVELPGGAVMAPPVLGGDTVVVALEMDHVCALLAGNLRTLWCRGFPGQTMIGHASASIDAGTVIASSVGTATTPTLAVFLKFPLRFKAKLLREILFPRLWSEDRSFQLFTGLDIATGRVNWTSPLFRTRATMPGHSSGTAAVQGGIGVIVLPGADTVVAFDTRTGTIRWTSGANQVRGPALILDGQVIVAGHNGVIEVRDLRGGALSCTMRRTVGFDRAGPVLAGGLLIFANLEGVVEAIPAGALLSCETPGAKRPTSQR